MSLVGGEESGSRSSAGRARARTEGWSWHLVGFRGELVDRHEQERLWKSHSRVNLQGVNNNDVTIVCSELKCPSGGQD